MELIATAPPQASKQVFRNCALATPRVIYSTKSRAKIPYSVMRQEKNNLYISLVLNLCSFFREHCFPRLCYIVYSNTLQIFEATASVLQLLLSRKTSVTVFRGQLSKKEKNTGLKWWMIARAVSTPTVMVATAAFGCETDVITVQAVVHVKIPQKMVQFLQECGRA